MLHSVGCPQPKAAAFINSWNSLAHDSSCVHGFIDGNDGTAAIKDRCLNLVIPQGMYVPVEAFIGNINQIDSNYNPNDEKDPMKRFINSFFCLAQYLFLHNLEFLEVVEKNVSAYNAPKPYEFFEIFRNLLCQENQFITEHLQLCIKKSKNDCDVLKGILNDFQDGDIVEFRNENREESRLFRKRCVVWWQNLL